MSNCIKRGAFIVFEGCDRSGKTTQCRKLVEKLKTMGIPAQQIQFPDRSTAIGKIIDDYLSKRIELTDQAVHLLFTANRWENEPKMRELLLQGVTLVSDRYSFSGVAYSSAKPNLNLNWCQQPESGLPKPDVVFFLKISSSCQRKGFGEERYETKEIQEQVHQNYLKLQDDTWKVS
ncbi:UNVERIFIED_CONTAM: hypothetical protein PYX00_001423 [Menopon gallinae]|uniref:Thymidylate kinase n=1 Tax=Menopon gallinae TaxID=328185 RepID=A0AAW2IDF4_9NEOP